MHFLYRHFDREGNLLYIGESLSAINRTCQHRRDSAWFTDIHMITIEQFETKDAAKEAEIGAIKKERPLHNVVFNAPPKPEPEPPVFRAPAFSQDTYLMNRERAAKFLGVPQQRMYRWHKEGVYGPPYYLLDGLLFYRRQDLIEWADTLRVNLEK
jgi:hypothetical protein